MKILITGGAGFIGSHLTESLLERGDSVCVADNFLTGKKENLPEHDRLQIHTADIADRAALQKVFAEFAPECVVHAAAGYKDPDDWAYDTRTNVLGSAHVAALCKEFGVRRLVYFQTALCYGLHPKQPITPENPINPEGSSYAISKTAGESYIRFSGVDFVSFRLANIIGPRNLSGPIAIFYNRIRDKKSCFVMNTRRDFVFVGDLVRVVLKALDGVGASGVYHVASGGDYEISQIFQDTLQAMGLAEYPVEYRERGEDDAPRMLLDPSLTQKTFDWKTEVPLAEAIDKAVRWYEQHGVEQAHTHLKIED